MADSSSDTHMLTEYDFTSDLDTHSTYSGRVPSPPTPCAGLPAYEEHPSTEPPAYNTLRPKATTQCTCHKQSTRGENSQLLGRPNVMIWSVLHVTFIGVIISILATMVSVVARIAVVEGYEDIIEKYRNASYVMHIISSVSAIPGVLLFYILFFSGRLVLNHKNSEDNS